MTKRRQVFTFLILTYFFSWGYLVYLFRWAFSIGYTGAFSLAKLAPIIMIPGFVSVLLALLGRTGFSQFGLKPKSWKDVVVYIFVPLLLLVALFLWAESRGANGHMGIVMLVALVMPLILVESFFSSLGWFGFFSPLAVGSVKSKFPEFVVGAAYSFWVASVYFASSTDRFSFGGDSSLVALAALNFGVANAWIRKKTQSLWPVIGLHLLTWDLYLGATQIFR